MSLKNGEEALRFLAAIGKESVCAGRLQEFASADANRRKREGLLGSVLEKELPDAQSPLVQSLLACLRNRAGLETITACEVVETFRQLSKAPATIKPPGHNAIRVEGGVLGAAASCLAEAGKPMHYRDLTNIMISTGRWQTTGKTPWATVNSAICMDIKNNRGSPFRKVGDGIFGLTPPA